jgi:hypothetical protein
MFRFLFRFIGLWLLAGAFVSLVIDGTRSITAGRIVIMPVAEAWLALHTPSIDALKTTVERDFPPWVWESRGSPKRFAPRGLGLRRPGTQFVLLGRKPPRPIGYSSRD